MGVFCCHFIAKIKHKNFNESNKIAIYVNKKIFAKNSGKSYNELLLHKNAYKKFRYRSIGTLFNGGAEGNRTPVRRQLDKTFSERSLLFPFPHPGGNKHPTGISSFMMHGMGKAYHTHGLHSNHTRARLVDLPGRMGA